MRLLVVAALAALLSAAVAGASLRSTAAGPARCSPHSIARVKPSSWDATRHAIAPRGATAVRLCRYSGLEHTPNALQRDVVRTRARVVRRLVRRLDALSPAVGAYSCPADDGRQIVAHFAYPDGHRLTVAVGLSGCRLATNGRLAGFATPALLRQLRRLTA